MQIAGQFRARFGGERIHGEAQRPIAFVPIDARTMVRRSQTLPKPPRVQVNVGVVVTMGACPLEYYRGQVWAIDDHGHLSSPFCEPAMTVLSSLSELSPEFLPEEDECKIFSCGCPLGDREVVFHITDKTKIAA